MCLNHAWVSNVTNDVTDHVIEWVIDHVAELVIDVPVEGKQSWFQTYQNHYPRWLLYYSWLKHISFICYQNISHVTDHVTNQVTDHVTNDTGFKV